ncbi:MAG: hypothetical protein IJG84_02200 [Kiritimatiellae bacterium]|nr:hypothetical protein [Kiritimatiellia bacterium]
MKLHEIIKKPTGGSLALISALAALAFALPSQAEDGYIESDGSVGAGINTGFFVGPQTKIEIDFQLTESSENQVRLFGAQGTKNVDTAPQCECYVGKNSSDTECFSFISGQSGNSQQSSNLKAIDTLRHRIVLDFYEAKEFQVWTGDSKTGKVLNDFPANRQNCPMVFFCKNYTASGLYSAATTTFAYHAKMKVYRFRIWDAGILRRDYLPCVKGGVAGFKETCSGQFVTGENVSAFSAGGDVEEEQDDPYIWAPRNVIGSVVENNVYIDTGYTVKANTRVEFDYAMMTNYASSWTAGQLPYLISSQTVNQNNSTHNFSYYIERPGCMVCHIGFRLVTNTVFGVEKAYNVRRGVSMAGDGNLAVVTAGFTNFTWKSPVAFNPDHTFSERRTLKIGSNLAGDGRHLPMKIYGLKIYESNNLVKDYVPFIENGVGGLKNSLDASDVLLSKTRINYSGTVSDGVKTNVVFDVGGNIACTDDSDEAYLEFDGTNTRGHYVLTDYILTKDSRVDVDFSLWNTKANSTQPAPAQRVFDQSTANRSNCILARMYINAAWRWSVMYGDNHSSAPAGIDTGIYINNKRLKFTIDSYNSRLAVTNAGVEVYNQAITTSRTWETGVTNLWIGGSYGGNTAAASMRLYSFRIYKKGELDRNYVPCVRNGAAGLYETCGNKFLQVLGGKVSGATLKGEAFQIAPEPAKLAKGDAPATLKCLAAGAQSYEWYVDGVKIDGETGETLSVEWIGKRPYTRTYSVRPVYTVFNERVLGDAAEALVEFTPQGVVMSIR